MINRPLYIEQIRPFYNTPIIKALKGIRRAGKSTLLLLIQQDLISNGVQEKQFFNLNMESAEGARLTDSEALLAKLESFFSTLEENQRGYVFLDEIQLLPGWERVVNACNTSWNADFYITGSNARLLSGDLATLLSGRYVSFQIHPFSFKEFSDLYQKHGKSQADLFMDYLVFGGMPSLNFLNLDYHPSMLSLQDIYNTVLLKDIVSYGQVRDVDLLERIVMFMLGNIGNTFSASSISKFFKSENRSVTADTVLSYLKLCENAFFLGRVRRQELPGKKLLKVNDKYYVADHGFREAIIGGNQAAIQAVLENIVYWELVRRGYKVSVGKIGDKEIDFVATKRNDTQYFQVTYLLADERTIEREFGAFNGISDNFGKYVLSMDQLNFSQNGIQHINIIDWLLE